jgi:hypothetical protein
MVEEYTTLSAACHALAKSEGVTADVAQAWPARWVDWLP